MTLLAFNKPYGVICQFSAHDRHPTLKDYIDVPHVYAAGRLDTDSEGLLLLTDDGRLQANITDPRHRIAKTYWAQVEGIPDEQTLAKLRQGVDLGDFITRPAQVDFVTPEYLWPRTPPIRVRKNIPDTWLRITLAEGKNRQVRRMCARVGHPCLRLVRVQIGALNLFATGLLPGQWLELKKEAIGAIR